MGSPLVALATLSGLSVFLAGCAIVPSAPSSPRSGMSIEGNVHGGQQPIVGAHVYLLAASTTGYGSASLSLLSAASTGLSDSIGAYVLSGAGGAFTITGDYTCIPGSQVYLYASGGNPGAGTNAASGLLAILGQCPTSGSFLTSTPYVVVNEVSTIAAAYSIAGFATDATHVSSSGTALAQVGVANAFGNAANLVTLSTGTTLALTPAGNGVVPQAEINTLGNILAACVNSSGPSSTQCTTLFANAESGGATGTIPTDTATAAINLAHHPATGTAALFGLAAASPPFLPALVAMPNDFAVPLKFFGGGLTYYVTGNSNPGNGVSYGIAIDGQGNAWIGNLNSGLSKFSPTGVALSPTNGFVGGGLSGAFGIAIDLGGNAWAVNYATSSVSEFSNAGIPLSPSSGYTGGGISYPTAVAIDGTGGVWVTNFLGDVAKLSSSGSPVSPSTGYALAGITPEAIAIDSSGAAWAGFVPSSGSGGAIAKFSNSGSLISPSSGFPASNFVPVAVAIDASNSVWVLSQDTPLTKLSSSGVEVSPAGGYPGGGLILGPSQQKLSTVAIDGAGNAFVAYLGRVSEFSNSGVALSPSTGFRGVDTGDVATGADGLDGTGTAIDGSGNVWASNQFTEDVVEFLGLATPVVTPLAVGVRDHMLGTRP